MRDQGSIVSYMAVKNHFDSCSWNLWDRRNPVYRENQEALGGIQGHALTDEDWVYEFPADLNSEEQLRIPIRDMPMSRGSGL